MSLPQPKFDDRDFQSLVDEARERVGQKCPEWNEHNVSDPGITLIELFAWMTDMLTYRVNRIPEKAQIALLDLVGVKLAAAEAARVDLRFRLSAPATSWFQVPEGVEVATADPPAGGPIVFATGEQIVVPSVSVAAAEMVKGGISTVVSVRAGTATVAPSQRPGLSGESHPDDGIYLAFDEPLSSLVLAVSVTTMRSRGTGIDPRKPTWKWEVQDDTGEWVEVEVVGDSTGGFNNASGTVELQLPRIERDGSTPGRGEATGRRARRLVRCLLQESTGASTRGYMHPPAIERIRVTAVGACVQALHATRVSAPGALPQAIERGGADALGPSGDALRARAKAIGGEVVGYSDGTPGQVFRLRRTPALKLERDDGLDVFDPQTGEWEPWMLRDSFAGSSSEDLHYCFDPVLGEVSLGPAIRERDGWVQRGAIPEEGLALRMRYRTGGGTQGNVEANTLTAMRRSISGIASVTNPKRACGGVDAETLGEVRRRAPAELRSHSRAVTAGDFEAIAREASRRVARARCVTTLRDAEIVVYVLPTLPTQPPDPAKREIELGPIPYDEMCAPDDVLKEVCDALDARRLLGMSVNVRSTPLRGVTVAAEVEVNAGTDGDTVERAVKDVLYRYLNPYTGGARAEAKKGWEYGEPVDAGKIRALVRAVRGVREVPILRLYDTDLHSGEQRGSRIEERLELAPDELAASAKHFVRVVERGA